MHHEQASLLTNTTVWYAVSVVLFVVLMYIVARKPFVGLLDGAIANVVAELEEAKRLRAEADETLKSYKAKQANALHEAEEIVKKAKADAGRLRDEAKANLKALLDRQEHVALERIKMVQEEAMEEVRAFVIEESLLELRGKLAKHATTPEASKIIDQVIADLPKLGKNKVA